MGIDEPARAPEAEAQAPLPRLQRHRRVINTSRMKRTSTASGDNDEQPYTGFANAGETGFGIGTKCDAALTGAAFAAGAA